MFSKSEQVDVLKLACQADLSYQSSLYDQQLIALALKENRFMDLEDFFKATQPLNPNVKIKLSDEIELLKQYVSLYQSLHKENFFLSFQADCSEDPGLGIYPLTLFPLVKNAIEKGYSSMQKHPIRIKVKVLGEKVRLEVSNRVNHHIQDQNDTDVMENFKAKLELLYSDNYQLIINSNSNIFKATLIV